MLGVIALCVAFGLLALLVALSRWLARRPWAAAGNVAVALLLLYTAHSLWPPVLHLATYDRMRPDAAVAQVHCERTGPSAYRVTLTRLPSGRMQVFEMTGDEWSLDARTLVWIGRAASLGLPPSYRLERLSGRYLRTEPIDPDAGAPDKRKPGAAADAKGQPTRGNRRDAVGDAAATAAAGPPLPASYALSDEDEPGEDVWAQARTDSPWRNRIDARHAPAPWRPLADGARYEVVLPWRPGQPAAALEVRPANEAAAKAMRYTRPTDVRTTEG